MCCAEQTAPEGYNDEKAAQILADLHLIQAALKQEKRDSVAAAEQRYMDNLLNIYGMNPEQLEAWITYAQSDASYIADLYPQVIGKLDSLLNDHKKRNL